MISRRQALAMVGGVPFLGALFRPQAESSSSCSSAPLMPYLTPRCCDPLELPDVDMTKREYNAEVIQSLPVEHEKSSGDGRWVSYDYVLVRLTNGKVRVARTYAIGKATPGQKLKLDADDKRGLFVRGWWMSWAENLKPAPDPMPYDQWVSRNER